MFAEKVALSLLPVLPMYIFLHKVHVMQQITIAEVHVKRSVILIDRLGPVILSALWKQMIQAMRVTKKCD